MRRQVDRMVEASKDILDHNLNVRRTWTQWMGANAALIAPHLWRDFEADSYRLITQYCWRSELEAPPPAPSRSATTGPVLRTSPAPSRSTSMSDSQQPETSTAPTRSSSFQLGGLGHDQLQQQDTAVPPMVQQAFIPVLPPCIHDQFLMSPSAYASPFGVNPRTGLLAESFYSSLLSLQHCTMQIRIHKRIVIEHNQMLYRNA